MADAVRVLVKYREPVQPNPVWKDAYAAGLRRFEANVRSAVAG